MTQDKIIATVAVSDEEIAHLRLLMRKGVNELAHAWRWGSETGADLLVVDASDFSGQMARVRAQATGVRVAVVCDAGADVEGGDLALRRPFKLANVLDVLNQVTDAVLAPAQIVPPRQNQYFAPEPDAIPSARAVPTSKPQAEVALGLEDMIRGNPELDPFANLKPPGHLDGSVGFEGTEGGTRRSELRSAKDPETRRTETASPPPNLLPPSKRSMGEDRTAHRLREYMTGDLIGGPSRIEWDGTPSLTLDPKNQVFHSEGTLAQLEAYCRGQPRRHEWRPVTNAELVRIREEQPAQAYQRLIWLDALLRSGGRLANQLDPGGTFSIKRWLEIRAEYPRHARISAAMMKPLRLHEIAAAAGASMDDVFDTVNAYDAIGWLVWTPRAPRHAPAPKEEKSLLGFVSKLRNPFSK